MTKLVNRAKMTTATTGTGTITLGTAEAGYQSFADAGVVDADVVRYVIEDGTAFEIGTGTFGSAGGTLTRTVSESSNADAALNLTGSAVVYVSATAEDIPPVLELYAENPSSPTAPVATGTNAVAIGFGAASGGLKSVSLADATANGDFSFAVQNGATANGLYSISIGLNNSANFQFATAVGGGAQATATNANAFGYNSRGAGNTATALTNSFASGTDSFAAAIANNTSTYGATGANSVAIGLNNKATTTYSVSVGGAASAVTGANASSIGGFSSVASGANSITLGGSSLTSSGSHSVSAGQQCTSSGYAAFSLGRLNTASGNYSVALGYNSLAAIYGKQAFASDRFTLAGDAQTGTFVLRSDTTGDTPEALSTNNLAANTVNQIILPNNSAYAFHGTIVARQQASQGTACAAFKIEGLIRREANAASTVLVNSATTVLDNTPAWGMALSADTTNGGLKIEVTGAAATNIRFVATIHTSEVTF